MLQHESEEAVSSARCVHQDVRAISAAHLSLEMFSDTVIKCEVFKSLLAERIGSYVQFW